MTQAIDHARLTLMLNDLRLPAIKQDWPALAERADKESWPAARFLATLTEHEIAERDRRRLARHLAEAQLLPGKTLDSFDFEVVPMLSKARVLAICAGDSWIEKGANLLLIGGPGGGKTHLASAIGLALVENGWRVMFARTSDLVQRLQVARRELALEAAINRLDRFHLLILDDLAYVSKDQAETSVLFELILIRSTKGEDESRRPRICSSDSGPSCAGWTDRPGCAAQAASWRGLRGRRSSGRVASADRRAEHGACRWPVLIA
jgi:DNA replication protein DnaC